MLGQEDDKSLCLPPIWIVPCEASRVGMSSGSSYRTVVIPELQPDLSCSLRVKKHEGLLKPLSCPTSGSRRKVKMYPHWWVESCVALIACGERFLFTRSSTSIPEPLFVFGRCVLVGREGIRKPRAAGSGAQFGIAKHTLGSPAQADPPTHPCSKSSVAFILV